MDAGKEQIEDEAVLAQIRRQVRKVYMESIVAAIALTVLCLVIPQ